VQPVLLGEIKCVKCGVVLAATKTATYREMCLAFQPMLVCCHATPPHCPHQMEFSLRGAPRMPELEHADELAIRCLSPDCLKAGLSLQTRAPLELVGALALVFHTSHEGHPIEMRYRDQTWTSPTKAP
jgi:hypothetical protein